MKYGCVALPRHFEFYILKCKKKFVKLFWLIFSMNYLGNFKQKKFTLQNVKSFYILKQQNLCCNLRINYHLSKETRALINLNLETWKKLSHLLSMFICAHFWRVCTFTPKLSPKCQKACFEACTRLTSTTQNN